MFVYSPLIVDVIFVYTCGGTVGTMINIFVINNYEVFRQGLISILEKHDEFQVIGDAASVSEALDKLDGLQPDIVIMDVSLPGGDGTEAINLLQQKFPRVKILIFTSSDRKEDFFKALKAGVRGYLLKNADATELIESIRLMASGDAIISPLPVFRLIGEFGETNSQNKDRTNNLSRREKEVLRLVVEGASNKEIATQCYVSETTAKAHLRRILEKLRVRNRAQAAALAISRDLLEQS